MTSMKRCTSPDWLREYRLELGLPADPQALRRLAHVPRARCELEELGYVVDVFAVALPQSRGVLLTREGRRELRAPGWQPLDTVLLNLARTRPGLSGHAYAAAVRACVTGRVDP